MKKLCLLACVVFFYALLSSASDLDSLVQSERDFSKTSGERGIRDAFLQYLAEDSILRTEHRMEKCKREATCTSGARNRMEIGK